MYDFLLVINTKLPPILHRFRDIAFDMSTIAILFWLPLLCLTPPAEGFLWDDLRKIFCGCQRMAKVPHAVEILPKILTAWVGCTSVTDRQTKTDRRTGRRTGDYRLRIARATIGSIPSFGHSSLAKDWLFNAKYLNSNTGNKWDRLL